MVLGIILYESADLAYNVVKLGYNGVTGVYNWWYQVEQIEKEESHNETKELIKQLKLLNNKVEELENIIQKNKKD
jgi:hypothetical protein|tara:strand:+ start:1579 stop:1803 length:225 start_codon:yes stop_codon:yes gene_type:complete